MYSEMVEAVPYIAAGMSLALHFFLCFVHTFPTPSTSFEILEPSRSKEAAVPSLIPEKAALNTSDQPKGHAYQDFKSGHNILTTGNPVPIREKSSTILKSDGT